MRAIAGPPSRSRRWWRGGWERHLGRRHERALLDVDLPLGEEVFEAELAGRAQLVGNDLSHGSVEEHSLLGQVSAEPVAKLVDSLQRGQIGAAPDFEIRPVIHRVGRKQATQGVRRKKGVRADLGMLAKGGVARAFEARERDGPDVLIDVVENPPPMGDAGELRHIWNEGVQRHDQCRVPADGFDEVGGSGDRAVLVVAAFDGHRGKRGIDAEGSLDRLADGHVVIAWTPKRTCDRAS